MLIMILQRRQMLNVGCIYSGRRSLQVEHIIYIQLLTLILKYIIISLQIDIGHNTPSLQKEGA